jgi:hypothetical protein
MSKVEVLLERIAKGIEHLGEEPVVEIEAGPPICPHCGKFNPDVKVNADEGVGPLIEFFVIAQCLECQKTIYALPLQWNIYGSQHELESGVAERSEITNGSG